MKQILTLVLLAGFGFSSAAQTNSITKVGTIHRDFMDSDRSNWLGNGPRPMRCIIWYPAALKGFAGKKEIVNNQSSFPKPVEVFPNAGLASKKGGYPLIILSHGSGGSARQMQWMGHYLASRSFIIVSVDHNGTAEEEKKPPGGLTLSDYCIGVRPKDISRVVDKMLADKFFAPAIDTTRIGVAGFSLGGASAIWVAGAIFNLDSLVKNGTPPPVELKKAIDRQIATTKNDPIVEKSREQMSNSFKDIRVKAVFALGPAIGQGFPPAGLQDITVPVMIVAGDADLVTPMKPNAQHYAKYIKGATLKVIPGEGGHYLKPAIGNEYGLELEKISEMANRFFKEKMNIK